MIFRNKKGVTPILGTILLILIAVAVAGILWQVIVPLTQKSATEAELATTCLNSDVKILTENDISYYNKSSDKGANLTIVVSRGAGELDLQDIQVIAYNAAGDSETYLMNKDYGSVLPTENQQKTYVFNSTIVPVKASLALKLKVREVIKLCDPIEKVAIESK